jgi:hypothetical protein
MLHVAHTVEGFFTHLVAVNGDGLYIVCGRSKSDLREDGPPNCAAFNREFEGPLWNRLLGPVEAEITGALALPDGAIIALENGGLYRITIRSEEG